MPGRIPDNFIQELLARTDIVEIIGGRLELKRAGREFKARSPFTEEKTPSFFVSPSKQMYFDFSSGKNGNAIGFVMDYDRVSFVDAIEILAQHAGLEVPREGRKAHSPQLDNARAALGKAAQLYQKQLQTSDEARAYLKQRGINAESVQRFGLGYAPASWDFITRYLSDPASLIAAGLAKQREGRDGCYDTFRHRLMFPIRDTRGRPIGFGGRALGDDPAKYLNSPETKLFHKGHNLFGLYEARQTTKSALESLIVVEGYMDAVMLAQYGITNVVAALGTATTPEQASLLLRSAPRVIFCFDGDRAGRAAAHRALTPVLPELRKGRECRFMFLPEGEDPDSLIRAEGQDAFVARVAQAQPLTEFLLSELAEGCELSTMAGRARLIEKARAPFALLARGPLRSVLVATLAERARLPAEKIETLLAEKSKPVTPESAQATIPTALPRSRNLRRALQLLGEDPTLATRVTDLGQLALAPVAGIPELMATLEFFIERPHSTASQFLQQRQNEGHDTAIARLWAKPIALETGQTTMKQEFDAAIAGLRLRALRARHHKLLEQAESEGLTPAAASELQSLTQQLSRA